MVTHERVNERTPSGADYSEIFYFNKDMNLCDKNEATSFIIHECKENGEVLLHTYGVHTDRSTNEIIDKPEQK